MLSSPVFANPNPRSAIPLSLPVSSVHGVYPDAVGALKPPRSPPPIVPSYPKLSCNLRRILAFKTALFAREGTKAPKRKIPSFVFNSLHTLLHLWGRGGIPMLLNQTDSSQSSLDARQHTQVLSFHTLPTLLPTTKVQLFYFQMGPHSLRKTPGWGEGFLLLRVSLPSTKRITPTLTSPHSPSQFQNGTQPPPSRLPNHPEFAIRHIAQQLTGRRAA